MVVVDALGSVPTGDVSIGLSTACRVTDTKSIRGSSCSLDFSSLGSISLIFAGVLGAQNFAAMISPRATAYSIRSEPPWAFHIHRPTPRPVWPDRLIKNAKVPRMNVSLFRGRESIALCLLIIDKSPPQSTPD